MKYEINAQFNDEMKDILSSMKGKTLKAITGVFDNGFKQVFGNIRLVLGQYVVDIENNLYPVVLPSMQGGDFNAEYAKFTCTKKNQKDLFKPYVVSKPLSFMFNEQIDDIMIIRDEITVSSGEHHFIDQALVIKTNVNAITISKPCWCMEHMNICISDKIEGVISIKDVKEDWSGEGQYSVDVDRQYTFL